MATKRHRKPFKPDLDERFSLHPLDPEEGLKRLLRVPPTDQEEDQGSEERTSDS